jgi:hypothetical protein
MAFSSWRRLVPFGLGAASLSVVLSASLPAHADDSVRAVVRPSAFVHVDVSHEVLVEAAEPGSPWVPQCLSPCDAVLPLTAVYRLRANGMKTSGTFSLVAVPGGTETLRVHEADPALFGWGIALVVAAPFVPALGLVPPSSLPDGLSGLHPSEVLAGAIVLGAAVLATGIVFLATNGATTVRQHVPVSSLLRLGGVAGTPDGARPSGSTGLTLLAW